MFGKRTTWTLAIAFAASTAYATAQTLPQMNPSVNQGEKAVATYFTEDSVGDVQLGQLGLKKSSNASVRALAEALVRDHTMTAHAGMRVAKAIGDDEAQLKPGDDNQIELTRLNQYSGAAFNRAYVKALVQAHQVDIATIKDALEFVSNSALKSYLHTTLAVDKRHLQMALSTQSKV